MGELEDNRNIMSVFFTNLDDDVFCLTNLPEVIKGTLFSRYSRSTKSLRDLFMDEFLNHDELKFIKDHLGYESGVNIQKAEEFYQRILIGFGDDSVAELGGAHIALENISNLAAKAVEDSRIGISPLEKSSRYVRFDDKKNGKYKYYRDEKIMGSKYEQEYESVLDNLFDTYSEYIEPLMGYYAEKIDENLPERVRKATIRAKALDTIRGLLPAATLTNVGLYGNGRAFEYLLVKLNANQLKEMQILSDKMERELRKVIPAFVRRVKNEKYGGKHTEYLKETENEFGEFANKIEPKAAGKGARLIWWDKEYLNRILATIIFPYVNAGFEEILKWLENADDWEKSNIIDKYCMNRTNRRHKPGRAFEDVIYTFEIVADFGAYRDLQRHRILTQQRQILTTDLGFEIPIVLGELNIEKEYVDAMNRAKELYNKLKSEFRYESQYVVPFGYNVRWYITLNAREAYHLCELRSSRQGHPNYRRIAQQIYTKIREVSPEVAKWMKYVDMNDYEFERLEAEKKIEKRRVNG